MDRREALKGLGALLLVGAVGSFGSQWEEEREEMERVDLVHFPYTRYRPQIENRHWNSPKDPTHLTKGELKHLPVITIAGRDGDYSIVEVTVGKIPHPSTGDHWIDFIQLFGDNRLLGEALFQPGAGVGYAQFRVKLDSIGELKGIAGCNRHGIWTTTLKLG